MYIVNDVDFKIQLNIYNAFRDENDYFVTEEVPGWLRAYGTNIVDIREGLMAGRAVFIFDTEEDYAMFLLKWA